MRGRGELRGGEGGEGKKAVCRLYQIASHASAFAELMGAARPRPARPQNECGTLSSVGAALCILA